MPLLPLIFTVVATPTKSTAKVIQLLSRLLMSPNFAVGLIPLVAIIVPSEGELLVI
ncbi:MAG TPA: hypothetical protein VGK02_03090 [Candidatus Aquicultor sp.]